MIMNLRMIEKLNGQTYRNEELGGEGGVPGGQPPEGQQVPTGGESSDWRSMLPEDIRNSPALADFKDVGTLAKSFVDTQAYVGNSIRIPSEEASEEQRAEFIQKLQSRVPELMIRPDFSDENQSKEFFRTLGMPEKPEEYEVPEVEGLQLPEDRVNFLREVAHKHGVTNDQFKGFMAEVLQADARGIQQQQEKTQQSMQTLKQEWGMAFDERVNAAKAVAKETGAPEALIDAIENNSVGGEVYKWLYQVGTQLGSEGINSPNISGRSTLMSPAEATERVNEIMANRKHPYWNAHDPQHKEAVKKVVELMKLANPDSSHDTGDLRAGIGA
jgi:hypothetical protein